MVFFFFFLFVYGPCAVVGLFRKGDCGAFLFLGRLGILLTDTGVGEGKTRRRRLWRAQRVLIWKQNHVSRRSADILDQNRIQSPNKEQIYVAVPP